MKPMLATRSRVFDDPHWLYELKYDGWRCLAERNGPDARLYSRQGTDITARFPSVAAAVLSVQSDSFVIDCEVVCLDDDAVPRLTALIEAARPTTLIAFDALRVGDMDARDCELIARKRTLKAMLKGSDVLYAQHVVGEGQALFDMAVDKGHEGVMAKRADSVYSAGRTKHWRKMKPRYEA